MDEKMERYWLWLCSCPGLYRTEILALTEYFHSPKGVYEADTRQLLAWKKLSDARSMNWPGTLINYKDTVSAAEAEAKLSRKNLLFVSRQSPDFPEKLKNLPDCPFGLFYMGHLPDKNIPAAAVVGARMCSSYGSQMAEVIGKALSRRGYQVISGMAAGIDSAAQRACVKEDGKSFALMGCGADICYPRESRSLYENLPAKGGVISEFSPGTPPLRPHFPMRNRLISGLSDVVVVIEARERSGSLITADMALDQGREVWAVPGRYSDPLSYGCNRLIGQGAGIIYSAESFLDDLELTLKPAVPDCREKRHGTAGGPELDENELKVYGHLDYDAHGIDEIARASGLTLLQTMTALLGLQMKGCACEVSKNRFIVKLAS